ncbi:MAG: hypothetical protein ABSD97_09325 [Acidimicrobiales bacterium]|jgi:hypothetical protein
MADSPRLGRTARVLRLVHTGIGGGELACLAYLWLCALTRRRDRYLAVAVAVLGGEGVALLAAGSCPFGILQRRAGDDVAMFELWFGPRAARLAVPSFSCLAIGGLALLVSRPVATRSSEARTASRTAHVEVSSPAPRTGAAGRGPRARPGTSSV